MNKIKLHVEKWTNSFWFFSFILKNLFLFIKKKKLKKIRIMITLDGKS